MKKYLPLIALIIVCSFGFTKYWANLNVNGDIIKTDPTYLGTLTIHNTADNQFAFNSSYIGDFMVAGPGNALNFGPNSLASQVRGATFASTTSGVPALTTTAGNVNLNQNTGTRTTIGPNITDDGTTQLQTKSIKATALNLGATTAGYVLTADANGNYTPQASTGGGTGASYTPTFSSSSGINSVSLNHAYYLKAGNIVHVSINVTFNVSATGLQSITFDLPSTANGSGSVTGVAGIVQSGSAGFTGLAANSVTTKGYINFYPASAVSSQAAIEFTYSQ